jgi:peptide/nickel transport system permease protein
LAAGEATLEQPIPSTTRSGDVRSSSLAWWIARRLLAGVLVLLLASLIVFLATQALPGDVARQILGRYATPGDIKALRDQLGLDRPLIVQYLDWLWGVLHGDFGQSLATQQRVSSIVTTRAANSAALLLVSGGISIVLGLAIGTLTAARRDGWLDNTVQPVLLALTALPVFVIGLALLLLLATNVSHVLPAVALIPPGSTAFSHPRELTLPALTLIIAVTPYLARLQRAQMIDVLESEYVQMARLKGLDERKVIVRHAARNSLVPIIQGSALTLIWLMGGIVTIEYLFAYPGLGSLLAESVQTRDLPVIQAVILLLAMSYIVFNLAADVLTVLVTPRLRTAVQGDTR